MGQLWSTVGISRHWATFLARGSRRGARRQDDRGDVVPAGRCTCPTSWRPRLGPRPHALQPERQDLRRPRRRDGRPSRRRLRASQDADRRRSSHQLGHPREHGAVRHLARREGDGALAGADRAVAPRSRSRPTMCARSSAGGGRRGTSSSSGGRPARSRRRSWGRRPGEPRRRSSATATGGAPSSAGSGASACGSRTGSSSGRVTRSRGHSSPSRSRRGIRAHDAHVGADEQEPLPALRRAVLRDEERQGRARVAIVAISTGRNESDRWWGSNSETIAATGATNTATCIEDVIAISVARSVLPRFAITIAPPCSAAFPTIATITTAMKNSCRPTALPNACSEWTRISETNAVASVATASVASDARRDHA